MDSYEQLFYKIEDYLRGKLPVEEAAAFQQEIATDPVLAELVEMHRFEQEGMEYLVEQDLRYKMQEWDTHELPAAGQKKNDKPLRNLGIVIGILLLLVIAFFLAKESPEQVKIPPALEIPVEQPEQEHTPDKPQEIEKPKKKIPLAKTEKENGASTRTKSNPLAKQYLALALSAYSFPESQLRNKDNSNSESILDPGLKAFADKNFDTAIKEFHKIDPASHPAEHELAQEYLAHAYFNKREFDQASRIFKSIADASSFNKDEPEWYLLLSLLGNYNWQKTQTESLLEKISSDDLHNYQQNAIDLKSKLSALKN